MRRIIGTIGATLAAVSVLGATTATAQDDGDLNPGVPQVVGSAYENYVDRDWPSDQTQDLDGDLQGDETQDPDGGLGEDWEDDWFEDYEEGDWFDREEASTALTLVNLQFVPWAQSHDKFVATSAAPATATFAAQKWLYDLSPYIESRVDEFVYSP
jgi:hypothetical protein